MIELFGMNSPNVCKVIIFLEELDLPYRLHHVDLFDAEAPAALIRMNPLGKVPVLVDDEGPAAGQSIFESGAILFYLAERYGRFLPAEGPARYQVMTWLMVQMANVGPIFGQNNHFGTLRARTHPGADPYATERYRQLSAGLYRRLDERLGVSPYLGGADYSIADIATWPWAAYLPRHGFAWADHAHLARWHDEIATRPAVERATDALRAFEPIDRAALTNAPAAVRDRFFGLAPAP